MKKIGFLGGTFNPIHNGHIEIAKIVADRISLDTVYLIPAGIPPHKMGDYRENAAHRLDMVRLAAEGDKRFKVSDYEIKKEGKSFSYITMEHFREFYKDDKLYFIMGDEAYRDIDTWKNPERLRAASEIVVVNRQNLPVEGAISITFPPIEISSTMIREKIKKGEDVSDFLPEKVLRYIEENNLYKG